MGLADFNIAQTRGDAVIALLRRAEVAPLPALYELLYDYVAGEQTLGALRAGSLVGGPRPSEDAGARLYEEFVRPYETDEAIERVIARTVERLAALDAMIVRRQEVSRSQSESLAAAGATLAGTEQNAGLMREWVLRLAVANDAARRANATLTAELDLASEELASARDEMSRLGRDALVDPLTGIANRAGLDRALSMAIAEAETPGNGFALAVVDIDRFKHFNDTYGHQAGDTVLRLVARALLVNIRAEDVAGRMGGDEFIAILHDATPDAALAVAEAIRRSVAEVDMIKILGPGVLGGITASIGVASYRDGDSIASLMERADRCLFEAKRQGRNRVVGGDLPLFGAAPLAAAG